MGKLINRLKKTRKLRDIQKLYKQKYAFVGIGNHSINNLYPVIDYLKVELKYIVVKSNQTAQVVNENYKNTTAITDLDIVLNDKEITGVFICANPGSHFKIVKRVLEANKNAFVEKPPCLSLQELNELTVAEKNSKGFVLVGLQKRYAPLYNILKKQLSETLYYSYKFILGNYPEGDPLIDLFIHPLDIITYLFGKPELISCQRIAGGKGSQTFLLHLKHENNAIGNLELSSAYWWSDAFETMTVSTKQKYLESKNTERLISVQQPPNILSIPLEKIHLARMQKKILFEQNNFMPVRENNQLYISGYFNEIKCFLDLCENRKNSNLSKLQTISPTYHLIEEIRSTQIMQ